VVALLRLGKKYDIEYQYKEALHYLQQEFPSTLTQYKAKRGRASIGIHRGQLIDLVNVALETNTLSILPAVYLKLASYPAVSPSIGGPEKYLFYLFTLDYYLCGFCPSGWFICDPPFYSATSVHYRQRENLDKYVPHDILMAGSCKTKGGARQPCVHQSICMHERFRFQQN